MDMAVVMDGAIAAAAGIITDGAGVVATITVGGIIAITGDLASISSERPPSWRPLSFPVAQVVSPLTCRPARVMSAFGRKAEADFGTVKSAFDPERTCRPMDGLFVVGYPMLPRCCLD
jgi:hypothetical protein